MREVVPTHSALLELRQEREGMQEGYRFLDEKRLVLAAEIVRELQHYETARRRFDELFANATAALQAAVVRHGLEGIQTHPVAGIRPGKLLVSERSVLGVLLQSARPAAGTGAAPPASGRALCSSTPNTVRSDTSSFPGRIPATGCVCMPSRPWRTTAACKAAVALANSSSKRRRAVS